MSLDSTESLDAGVFAPKIEVTLGRYTMASDIVFGSIQHSLTHVAIQVRVVVIYYPLALGDSLWVVEGVVVGSYQL